MVNWYWIIKMLYWRPHWRVFCRSKGDLVKQALPLLPSHLLAIFSFLTINPGHVSWRAAILCCFRGLLRKCQVTLSDSSLRRKNFKFFRWGMVLKITRTKMIQFSERFLQIPIARCQDIRLCAVHWTELHFTQLPASPDSLAFRVPVPGRLPLWLIPFMRKPKKYLSSGLVSTQMISPPTLWGVVDAPFYLCQERLWKNWNLGGTGHPIPFFLT